MLRFIFRGIKFLWRINIAKTLYLNFCGLPFRQAVRLPIHVYGKCVVHSLNGQIVINAPTVSSGMIRIGYRWWDLFLESYLPTQLSINGSLIFHGPASVSGGVALFVNDNAQLSLGSNCTIGGGSQIDCQLGIQLLDSVRITGNCLICDSDGGYIKDIESGRVESPYGRIVIGRNSWLNYGTIITKGVSLPDYSITARHAVIDKGQELLDNNRFYVGNPAKITPPHLQRIISRVKEIEYNNYFHEHADTDDLCLLPGLEDEDNNPFKANRK